MKKDKIMQVLFLVIGTLTALEFIFVRGLFTWLIAVIATVALGIINIGINIKNKDWIGIWYNSLLIVALCMGYFYILG